MHSSISCFGALVKGSGGCSFTLAVRAIWAYDKLKKTAAIPYSAFGVKTADLAARGEGITLGTRLLAG